MRQYKILLIKFFLTINSLLLLTAYFNYKIDSLSLFSVNEDIYKTVSIMKNKFGVEGINNLNDRLIQKTMISQMSSPPDTIVLGSSRIMYFNSNLLLSDQTFFNHWVSGGDLKDYFGIIATYLIEQNTLPKKIFIGLDPWIFNKNKKENGSATLKKEYSYMLSKLGIKNQHSPRNLTKYKQLLNFEYTKENIKYLKNRVFKSLQVIKKVNETEDKSYRNYDGSIHQSKNESFPNIDKTKLVIKKYLNNGYIDYLDRFYKIDNFILFDKLISFLQKNNVDIEFILLPFHPTVYTFFNNTKEYKMVLESESLLINYANEKKIKLIGSYDPTNNNFNKSYFFDGIHGVDRVIKKLIEEK